MEITIYIFTLVDTQVLSLMFVVVVLYFCCLVLRIFSTISWGLTFNSYAIKCNVLFKEQIPLILFLCVHEVVQP